jgi:hypothetical protein
VPVVRLSWIPSLSLGLEIQIHGSERVGKRRCAPHGLMAAVVVVNDSLPLRYRTCLLERVNPELRHLQAQLAAQLPYRQAAALLEELLPETGGLNYSTTRNRTLAVGKRIEKEIRGEIDHPTGRVETPELGGEAFAVVRDLDPYAKRRVQAILRRCGRGQDTDLRILSDGEDGLRGLVGTWFGKKCEHRLDWFHVARRIGESKRNSCISPMGMTSRNASRFTGQT